MFQKAPSNSQKLLDEIISSENSVSLLRDKLKKASPQQDRELRGILRELQESGYLTIFWANNEQTEEYIADFVAMFEEKLGK